MRSNLWIGVVFFFLLLISIPITTGCSSIIQESLSINNLADEQGKYPIILHYFTGLKYTKEIQWISAEDATMIRSCFEYIDNVIEDDNEKIQKKHDILASCDFVKKQHFQESTYEYPLEDGRGVGLFFSKITGFFGPSSINLLSVFFAAPFFITRARGISVHISGVFYPSFDFVSFQLVNMRILGFIGLLIVFPFLSIGGYMDGVAFIGRIQEI